MYQVEFAEKHGKQLSGWRRIACYVDEDVAKVKMRSIKVEVKVEKMPGIVRIRKL